MANKTNQHSKKKRNLTKKEQREIQRILTLTQTQPEPEYK